MRLASLALVVCAATLLTAGCQTGGSSPGSPADDSFRARLCAQEPAFCASPSPTPPVPTAQCQSDDLVASAAFGPDKYNPEPGPIDGILIVALQQEARPCLLSSAQTITVSVGNSVQIPVAVTPVAWRNEVIVSSTDGNVGGAYLHFLWNNWCRDTAPANVTMNLTVGEAGQLAVPVVSSAGSGLQRKFPPCVDASGGSELTSEGGFDGRIPETGLQPCRAQDLTVTDGSYNEIEQHALPSEGPQRGADMWLGRNEAPGCTLTAWDHLKVTDGNLHELSVNATLETDVSRPAGHVNYVFGPTDAYERIFWTNWCGERLRGPLHVFIELPHELGTIDWTVGKSVDADGYLITPPCSDPSKPSELAVTKEL